MCADVESINRTVVEASQGNVRIGSRKDTVSQKEEYDSTTTISLTLNRANTQRIGATPGSNILLRSSKIKLHKIVSTLPSEPITSPFVNPKRLENLYLFHSQKHLLSLLPRRPLIAEIKSAIAL